MGWLGRRRERSAGAGGGGERGRGREGGRWLGTPPWRHGGIGEHCWLSARDEGGTIRACELPLTSPRLRRSFPSKGRGGVYSTAKAVNELDADHDRAQRLRRSPVPETAALKGRYVIYRRRKRQVPETLAIL